MPRFAEKARSIRSQPQLVICRRASGHRPAARALVELEGGVGRAADGVEWSVLLIPARRVHSADYALLGDHEHGRLVVVPGGEPALLRGGHVPRHPAGVEMTSGLLPGGDSLRAWMTGWRALPTRTNRSRRAAALPPALQDRQDQPCRTTANRPGCRGRCCRPRDAVGEPICV